MIHFRCWYCNRAYAVAQKRVGERLVCGCKHRLRVPRRSGGSSRARSLLDWVIEGVVYGGGGGMLGFLLAFVVLSKTPFLGRAVSSRNVVFAFTLTGFLAGLLTGEAGVNWLGRVIRRYQQR